MIPEYVRQQAKIELARRSIWEYSKLRHPNFFKEDREYLKTICNEIQAFTEQEEYKFLLLNIPPRHGKSFTVKNTVEWLFGHDNRLKIITGSYNEILSGIFATQVRNTIQEEKTDNKIIYSDIFPNTKIKYGEASAKLWALEGQEEKSYLATSPTGTSTGLGANCLTGETLILTTKGKKTIKEICNDKNKHQVLTYNHENDTIEVEKIIATQETFNQKVYEVELENGKTIRATKEHKIYTNKGYKTIEWCITEINRQPVFVYELWETIHKEELRNKKIAKKGNGKQILFKRMFVKSKRKKAKKKFLSMWKFNSKKKKKILFTGVFEKICQIKKIKKYKLPIVWKRISPFIPFNKVLFNGVQEYTSQHTNDGKEQSKLQRGERIQNTFFQNETSNKTKRQSSMPTMWKIRTERKRKDKFKSSPFRLGQTQQYKIKFDNSVCHLSSKYTQIKRIKEYKKLETVYDIQTSQNHNFIACDFLVHNCVIIDDLIKNDMEAYNELVLEKHWSWLTNTILSRLEGNDWKVIVVMTRWSENDLAGRLLQSEYKDLVKQITFPVLNEDGSMLCDEIMNRETYEIKIKEMNPDIAEANYNQKLIDMKNRLYNDFKVWEELPKYNKKCNYTDTADTGEDYYCSINYVEYEKEVYITDILFTQESMDITEDKTADLLYINDVNEAVFESNNGGRYFSKKVGDKIREKYNSNKCVIKPKTQRNNKESRILSNSSWVNEHIYMPLNWQHKYPEFYKHIKNFMRKGKNVHDDGADVLTAIAESINNKPKIMVSNSRIM